MDLYSARLIGSALCILVSAYLAVRSKEGWGWFLFVALLLAPVKGLN